VPDEDKSIPQVLGELKELTVNYAKQETVVPLRNVGRWVAFGVGGSFVLGIGLCLLSLSLLRALQTETTVFEGGWSWAPYLITAVVLVAVAALTAYRIKEKPDGRR
jgi:peptidoglycan/LPS O-acetylase OafA/YrhL